jgi:transposase InsO family protein
MKTMERSGYSLKRTLKILGISRSWYYSQMDFSPILDGRFNPMAIRSDDEWIVTGFRNEHPVWESTRPEHAKSPDERWQTDIMYVKIQGWFFYLIIFIDEYGRYIVHHNLLTSMDVIAG